MNFTCYVVAAERLKLGETDYRRGDLVFDDCCNTKDFKSAVAGGEVIEIDPLGDLHVQFTIGLEPEIMEEPVPDQAAV